MTRSLDPWGITDRDGFVSSLARGPLTEWAKAHLLDGLILVGDEHAVVVLRDAVQDLEIGVEVVAAMRDPPASEHLS